MPEHPAIIGTTSTRIAATLPVTPPASGPTDPGPFQKYLFSGACYVQVGECYRLLQEILDNSGVPSTNQELQARLAALWHDQALRQSAMMALMPAGNSPLSVLKPGMGLPVEILDALTSMGQQATRDMVKQFDPGGRTTELPDIDVFFDLWVKSCSQTYQAFAGSAQFSRALGEAVNFWIRVGR